MNTIALIKDLKPYEGRITDIDTHEMMPAQEWINHFGDEVREIAEYFLERGEDESINPNTANVPAYRGDTALIDADIVNVKGPRSPGAVNPARRVEVMDAMGVSRQLMYPTGLAVFTMNLYKFAHDPSFMSNITGDRLAKAKRWIDLHNEWMIEAGKLSDRVRPVPVLYGDTPEELIGRAKHFLDNGIRAVWFFPAGELPGGRSPAHPDLDPLWAMLAEADCAATVHVAGDGKFFNTTDWRDAPAFEGFVRHAEINFDPWFLATLHQPYQNFLTVMLLGGVFERHPTLRFGVIECGAYWAGPMIRRLDMWYATGHKVASAHDVPTTYRLPQPPSSYLKRNVRVTPYVFEDFSKDMEWYDIEDVVCFSTDYPHIEGGKNAFDTFNKRIARFCDATAEKFFVTNGQLLLPD